MLASLQGKIKIGSIFIMDPTLQPKKAKPEEEEFTDAKIMYFHPISTDIHEKRKQVGISEGIVSFFLPFTDNTEPVQQKICLEKKIQRYSINFLMFIVTKLLNQYGFKVRFPIQIQCLKEKVYFQLFHGNLRDLWSKTPENNFESILEDFTKNFDYHFFTREFEKNFFWNISFAGLFYCPIEKKQFLQTQLLVNSMLNEFENDIQHVMVFHEEFYISSTLPHQDIQTLYSYIVGCGECARDKRRIKAFTYKEGGNSQRIRGQQSGSANELSQQQINTDLFSQTQDSSNDNYISISHNDLLGADEALGISNFGKINSRVLNQPYNSKALQYVIGPMFPIQSEQQFVDIFAPRVYLRNQDGEIEAFKLFVFQGHKTLITLLFKSDYQFTYEFVDKLTQFLNLHTPPISNQLDQIIQKVLSKEDPLRFMYFNQMNLALKFSNLITKEIFTPELVLTLNQIHETFSSDPDCVEQHMNNSFYWLVGINSSGREIYLIFPPNYTSSKVEVEKKKILAAYFQNLFI